MSKLPGPYEIFDIGDNESVELRILKTESGEVDIHPNYGKEIKTVTALRLFLDKPWQTGKMFYLDITSQRLGAILGPYLQDIPSGGKVIRIKKYGIAPKAVFSVEVFP